MTQQGLKESSPQAKELALFEEYDSSFSLFLCFLFSLHESDSEILAK